MTRTFDLAPFNRATIGFDRILNELDRVSTSTYPPYNIVKNSDDEYTITLAVAGFKLEDLNIVKDKNQLVIEGNVAGPTSDDEPTYLHRGIAARGFSRAFTLADYVEVDSATLELGLLNIKLKRVVPEEMQPKRIAITSAK